MKKLILVVLVLILVGCSSKHQVLIGAGFSYVPFIPADQLTGHEQFHISVEHTFPINNHVDINTSWHHFSNGAQLGIGRRPNYGFDSISTRFTLKLF